MKLKTDATTERVKALMAVDGQAREYQSVRANIETLEEEKTALSGQIKESLSACGVP